MDTYRKVKYHCFGDRNCVEKTRNTCDQQEDCLQEFAKRLTNRLVEEHQDALRESINLMAMSGIAWLHMSNNGELTPVDITPPS